MESEKKTEKYLRDKVKGLGGKAYKFVSPGNNGVPDRLVVLPGGKSFFAELKSPGGRLSELQVKQINYLISKGQPVFVIYDCAGVDKIFEGIQGGKSL